MISCIFFWQPTILLIDRDRFYVASLIPPPSRGIQLQSESHPQSADTVGPWYESNPTCPKIKISKSQDRLESEQWWFIKWRLRIEHTQNKLVTTLAWNFFEDLSSILQRTTKDHQGHQYCTSTPRKFMRKFCHQSFSFFETRSFSGSRGSFKKRVNLPQAAIMGGPQFRSPTQREPT